MNTEMVVLALLGLALIAAEIGFRVFLAREETRRKKYLAEINVLKHVKGEEAKARAMAEIRQKQMESLARQYNLDIAVVESVCEVMGDESITDGTLAQALSTF